MFNTAELLSKHGPTLRAVARRYLRDEDECEDAVQEAILSALRHGKNFRGESSLSTWLYRIVVNVCLMRLRSRLRHPTVPLHGELDDSNDRLGSFAPVDHSLPSAPQQLSQQELGERVRNCINQLPESYRQVLDLRCLQERSTEETAQALGITSGAVKVRLHRARQMLVDYFTEEFRDDSELLPRSLAEVAGAPSPRVIAGNDGVEAEQP